MSFLFDINKCVILCINKNMINKIQYDLTLKINPLLAIFINIKIE